MQPHRNLWFPFFFLAGIAMLATAEPDAGDWRQWGGPEQDFTVRAATPLATDWPEDGPPEIWNRPLGDDGFAGIVATEGRLFTMYRRGDEEVVVAVDAKSGETVWESAQDVPLDPDKILANYGSGPNATPAIAGGRIFTSGVMLDVRALDLKTGEVLWTRDLIEEMGAPRMRRGHATSPLISNDLVILTPGCVDYFGSAGLAGAAGKGGGVIALRQNDGSVAWKSTECFLTSYSSPILGMVDGEEQILVAMGPARAGLDPKTGALRWKMDFGREVISTMSTQLWDAEQKILFGTAAYADGSRAIKLQRRDDGSFAAEELWYTRKMRVHHGTTVRIGDYIYGSSGDFGPAFLTAVHIATGEVAFRQRGFAKANLLVVGDRVIILDEDGHLAIGTPSPDGIEIHARAKVLERLAWTVPTLVGTRLYLRDRHRMKALELAP